MKTTTTIRSYAGIIAHAFPRVAAVAALLLAPAAAFAAESVWETGTGDWHDPVNWNPEVVPDAGIDARVSTGTAFLLTGSTGYADYVRTGSDGGSGNIGAVHLLASSTLFASMDINIGDGGKGALTIEDGAYASATNGLVNLGQGGGPGDHGILNLLVGGTLATQGFARAPGGNDDTAIAELNLNGGVIVAAGPAGVYTGTDDFFRNIGGLTLDGAGITNVNRAALTLDVADGIAITATNNFTYVQNAGASAHALEKTGAGLLTLTGVSDLVNGSNNGEVYVNGGTLALTGYMSSAQTFVTVGVSQTAAVIVSGTGVWESTDNFYVGGGGVGALVITDSGTIKIYSGIIGNGAQTRSTVSVGGTGVWDNSSHLYIGYSGKGALDIADSGTVKNDDALIGYNPGSHGSAHVSGTGVWEIRSYLYVGSDGTGAVNITDSAYVDVNRGTVIGHDLTGSGTLTLGGGILATPYVSKGAGSASLFLNGGTLRATASGTFFQNLADSDIHLLAGGVTFDTGATVSGTITNNLLSEAVSASLAKTGDGVLTLTGSNDLVNGSNNGRLYAGGGTLGLAGYMKSYGASIAQNAGQSAAIVVGGTGVLENTGGLHVGDSGTGALVITDAGTVKNTDSYIGANPGIHGSVLISGTGLWENAGSLNIGLSGTGALRITDSGYVKAGDSTMLGTASTGSGTLALDGGVLETPYVEKGAGSASMLLNGGTLRPAASGSFFQNFADSDIRLLAGGLTIDTGATISGTIANNLAVAAGVTAAGLAKIGDGSLTLAGALHDLGDGALTVATGTLITGDSAQFALGSVSNAAVITGETAALRIQTGATVTNAAGALITGGQTGVQLDAGGSIANAGLITGGDAALALTGPAQVTNTGTLRGKYGALGAAAGDNQSLAITAAGLWENTDTLAIGAAASATLSLRDNARVDVTGPAGSATLATNATLLVGAGQSAVTAGIIGIASQATLAFDLGGVTAGASAPALLTLDATAASAGITFSGTQNLDIRLTDPVTYGIYNLVAVETTDLAASPAFTPQLNGATASTRSGTAAFLNTSVTGADTLLQLTLADTDAAMNLNWTGASGTLWRNDGGTASETLNWSGVVNGQPEPLAFLDGDAVTFGATGYATIGDVAIDAAGVTIGAVGGNPGMTIAGGTWNFTGGAITGGAITYTGTSTVTFGGPNPGGAGARTLTQISSIAANANLALSAAAGATLTITKAPGNTTTSALTVGAGATLALGSTPDAPIVFAGNMAANGGAIYNTAALTGTNLVFTSNTASFRGGAFYSEGGATATFASSTFTGNAATSTLYGGGAIYNTSTSTFTGSNLVFTSNTTAGGGGALYNTGGATATFASSTFTGNVATFYAYGGGAIYNANTSTFTGSNLVFTSNTTASAGGALYNTGGATATFASSTFTGNAATSTSYGGGAIYNTSTSTFTGSNLVFTSNTTVGSGGALYNNTGGGAVTFVSSTFTGNIAANGGALFNGDTLIGTNLVFTSNTAVGQGGVFFNASGTATLVSSTFTGNVANSTATGGGAIYNRVTLIGTNLTFTSNTAARSGGALFNDTAGTATLVSSTFTGNAANSTASTAGGGAIYNVATFTGTNLTFTSNTAANNGGAIYNASTGALTLAITAGAAISATGNTAGTGTGGFLRNDGLATIDVGADGSFTIGALNAADAALDGISGAGALVKTGAGLLTLHANNTNTGLVTISAGTLALTRADNLSAAPVHLAGATATLDTTAAQTFTRLTGAGLLNAHDQDITSRGGDASNITFTDVATFTVDTGSAVLLGNGQTVNALNLQAGALTISASNTSLNVATTAGIAANTTLNLAHDDTATAPALNAGGAMTIAAANTTLNLASYDTSPATFPIQSGTYPAAAPPSVTLVTATGGITGDFANTTIGGNAINAAAITLDEFAGATIQKIANAPGLGDSIVAQVGLYWYNTATNSAHGTFNITDANLFEIKSALVDNTVATAWAFGWDGESLAKTGDGALILSATNTYTGTTLVAAGTLVAKNVRATGAGDIVNDATFQIDLDAANTGAYANNILGTGTTLKTGDGELTTTGAITQTVRVIAGKYINDGQLETPADAVQLSDAVTFENQGSVSSAGAATSAVYAESGAVTIINRADAILAGAGYGIYMDATGTITNEGLVTGAAQNAVNFVIGGELINTGTIHAENAAGVYAADAPVTVTNRPGAEITGLDNAVWLASGTVDNSGRIAAATAVRLDGADSLLTNHAGASIEGADTGAHLTAAGTLANLGRITGDNALLLAPGVHADNTGTIAATFTGVFFNNGAGTLANRGVITGTNYGGVVAFAAPADIANETTGLITGGTHGVRLDAGGAVHNSGTILGLAGNGIVSDAPATIITNTNGLIQGAADGVALTAGGTIRNLGSGLITGTGALSSGVRFDAGAADLVNGATITGGGYGVFVGGTGAIVNTGVITGTNTAGVLGSAGPLTVTNTTGGAITGGLHGVLLEAGGDIVNSSLIFGLDTTNGAGITSANIAVTATNTGGIIQGALAGIRLGNGGDIANTAGGVIIGIGADSAGIRVDAGLATITNSAQITGGEDGIRATGTLNLVNSGFIAGLAGAGVHASAIAVVTNTTGGIINGPLAYAINLDADAANQVHLWNGSALLGNLRIAGDASLLTLNGAASQSYAAAVTGSTTFTGTLVKLGAGTWDLDSTAAQLAVLAQQATRVESGTLIVNWATHQLNNAPATIDAANASTLQVRKTTAASATFDSALTGGGYLDLHNTSADSGGQFALGASVGPDFSGTIGVRGMTHTATFILDDASDAALTAATLRLDANSATTLDADRTIHALDLAGGAMNFKALDNSTDGVRPYVLTVDTLAATAASKIGVDTAILSGIVQPITSNAGLNDNIFDVDVLPPDYLLNKRTLIDSTGTGPADGVTFDLVDSDGNALPTGTSTLTYGQNGVTPVGKNTYGYNAATQTGDLVLNYGLISIESLHATERLLIDPTGSLDKTLSAKLTGAGAGFTFTGDETITLAHTANDYTGATLVTGSATLLTGAANIIQTSSTVTIDAGAAIDLGGYDQRLQDLSGAGNIHLQTATLTVNNTAPGLVFSGVIDGAGGVTLAPATAWTLTGQNTYAGPTAIGAGAQLQLGEGNTTGVIADASAVANSGTLVINRGDDLVYGGAVTGTGAFIQRGAGKTTLTGANQIDGGLVIEKGALQIGQNDATGWATGTIAANARVDATAELIFNRADTVTYTGVISGAGDAAFTGEGVTILKKAQTYTGATRVENGALRLDIANALQPSSGLTLTDALLDLNNNAQTLKNLQTSAARIRYSTPAGLATTYTTLTITGTLAGDAVHYMNVDLVDSKTDKLIVQGSATGDHWIEFASTNDTPLDDPARTYALEVVKVGDGSTAGFDSDGIESGFQSYKLYQGDGGQIMPDENAWYLSGGDTRSRAADAILVTAGLQGVDWHYELDNVHKRMGDIRADNMLATRHSPPAATSALTGNVWARASTYRVNASSDLGGSAMKQDTYGITAGADKIFRAKNALLALGGYIGMGHSSRTFDEPGNQYGDGKTNTVGGGLYALWIHDAGWFIDATLKFDRYDNTLDARGADGIVSSGDYTNQAQGLSIEAGRRIYLGTPGPGSSTSVRYWFEPAAQIAAGWINGADYTVSNGVNPDMDIHIGDSDAWQYSASLRGGADLGKWRPYVKLGAVKSDTNGGEVTTDGRSYQPWFDGWRLEAGAGVSYLIDGKSQLYLDYEYNKADYYERPWALNLGYRRSW